MYTTTNRKTFCSVCHKPNDTYEQWRQCQHDHQIERWMADPQMRRHVNDCRRMLEDRKRHDESQSLGRL